MSDWFPCPNCSHPYRFHAIMANRAMACNFCGFVFRVPMEPLQDPIDTPLTDADGGQWRLQFSNGRQFGPVSVTMIAEWVREGRAHAESLVCPDGVGSWYRLDEAFPDLFAPEHQSAIDLTSPITGALEELPAAGLLTYFIDHEDDLDAPIRAAHESLLLKLRKEVRKTMGAVAILGWRSILLGEARFSATRTSREDERQLRADHAIVVELAAHGTSFYMVVPWSRLGPLAHEFFSILPGKLPHSIALRRDTEHDFAGGQWIGINGREDDIVAVAARRSQDDLIAGIAWEWIDRSRKFSLTLVWGLQAIPLGPNKFLHVIHTAERKRSGAEFGLLWYLERQSAFFRFSRRLSIPDTHEHHVLFACATGQLLCDAADHVGDTRTEAPLRR
jgi:uncharacterized protein YbaR (Trm112 family)